MSNMSKYHVPLVTAAYLISVPLIVAFFAGAGAGTVLDSLAGMLGVFFGIFGGASIAVGILLLLWVGWRAWRDGVSSKEVNG